MRIQVDGDSRNSNLYLKVESGKIIDQNFNNSTYQQEVSQIKFTSYVSGYAPDKYRGNYLLYPGNYSLCYYNPYDGKLYLTISVNIGDMYNMEVTDISYQNLANDVYIGIDYHYDDDKDIILYAGENYRVQQLTPLTMNELDFNPTMTVEDRLFNNGTMKKQILVGFDLNVTKKS